MNRLDIIQAVSRMLGSKTDAARVVRAVFDSIKEALRKDDKVVISNFGTFRVKQRDPRQGRNPRTGEKVSVPSRRSARFKASRNLLK